MDYLLLILLAALLIVPAVFLGGFVGCAQIAGLDSSDPPAAIPTLPARPTGLKAKAISESQIDLEWDDLSGGAAIFTVFRGPSNTTPTKISETVKPVPGQAKVTFQDKGLAPFTTFFYRVQAVVGSDKSTRSDPASATTFLAVTPPPPGSWIIAYHDPIIPLTENDGVFADDTGVQRIGAALLSPAALGKTKIRITIRGSTNAGLVIDKTTLSEAALTGNLYDSAPAPAPLAQVFFGGGNPQATVPQLVSTTSDPADFTLNAGKDLLVAFDIGSNGDGRRAVNVTGATFFSKKNVHEASQRVRSANGYLTQANAVYFIEKIEVM